MMGNKAIGRQRAGPGRPKIRLGLCCCFVAAPIAFKTTTVTHLQRLKARGDDYLAYLAAIVAHNIDALRRSIAYCAAHDIGAFRVNSALLPAATHPLMGYDLAQLPGGAALRSGLGECGALAKRHAIRLTFHPDQFVILNSPRPEVVKMSLADIEQHAVMAQLLGADVVNIHGGGAYGDKKSALAALAANCERLSAPARALLTLENDDKIYTPADLLPLCRALQIPLVYDVHHHRCLGDGLTVEEASEQALQTWRREPLFHISSPLEGWRGPKPQRHHDYIDSSDVPSCWRGLAPLTIDVEAKAKELAVERLYGQLRDDGWPL